MPRAHVVRLHTDGTTAVQRIEFYANGRRQFLVAGQQLAANGKVVLAAGTIESTRLALESFPTTAMGRNLMAHLRSNTTVRIRRARLSGLPMPPQQLEAAALLVRGSANGRRYHLQVTAAANQSPNPEAYLFSMIPDIDLLPSIEANQDPAWVVLTLRGIGEMVGDPNTGSEDPNANWINLSPFDRDEFQMQRAWVNLVVAQQDRDLWRTMDDAALALARALADNNAADIQYFYKDSFINDLNDPGSWHNAPPPASPNNNPNDAANKVRDPLGSTHHEAGTMWMGTAAATSVTNPDSRFHHVDNAYVVGPAAFPTLGSANPSLTAFALALQTVAAL